MKPLKTDLTWIADHAQQHADDNDAFCYFVEDAPLSDTDLDRLVAAVAAPISAAVDCLACGNCCRSLAVYLTPDDADRLAGVNVPLTAIIDHDRAHAVEEWGMFRDQPCTFLDGNFCRVYAHRPQSCRDYPTFTPDFRWQIRHLITGAGLCPIIFHVVEALKYRLNWYNDEEFSDD